jgi:integrase
MPQLNEKIVRELPIPSAGNKIHSFGGATLQGVTAPGEFGICVTPAGAKSFVLGYRYRGVRRRMVIGQWPTWSALQAVKEAKELRRRVDRGEDPLGARRHEAAAAENTFKRIAEEFLKQHTAKLRTVEARRRDLQRLAYPTLGNKAVEEIRRSDVVKLLDRVADENGAVMADRLLAFIRKVFNWHATRSDDFVSPIVKGMARNASTPRQRVLSDDEIRRIWTATGDFPPAYLALVKFLLLTGARRAEAAEMPRQELSEGVWLLPAARNKVKVDHMRPLPKAALEVLPEGTGKFVFSLDGGSTPIVSFSRLKRMVDKASGVTGWTIHDLRRTARSLMSRAGVPSDHAEQVLGHILPGVKGVYDRHSYFDEKRLAFEKLAALVDRIVNPIDNVTALRHGAMRALACATEEAS